MKWWFKEKSIHGKLNKKLHLFTNVSICWLFNSLGNISCYKILWSSAYFQKEFLKNCDDILFLDAENRWLQNSPWILEFLYNSVVICFFTKGNECLKNSDDLLLADTKTDGCGILQEFQSEIRSEKELTLPLAIWPCILLTSFLFFPPII